MATKTVTQITAELSTLINDNTTADITPADMRTALQDIVDSIQPKATAAAAPPTATDGAVGDIQYDATTLYIKTAAGWKTAALS